MPAKPFFLSAAAITIALMLSACGGGHTRQSTTTSNAGASPAASPAASPNAPSHAQSGGATAGSPAPVPASLNCGAVSPVWANTRTHVYHVASDPLYGRTKHGQYMCPEQAASAGYHQAGGGAGKEHHHRHGGGAMQAQPSPSP
jgi:hypothetical protein